MRAAVRLTLTLTAIMNEEVEQFVGAAYGQVCATRRDYRNGYYRRDLVTTAGKIEELAVPRTQGGFRTQVCEQYQRRQRELDIAIGEMFVKGISTSGVGQVLEVLTGQKGRSRVRRRCRGYITACKPNTRPGSSASCPADTSTCLRMARISA